MRDHGGVGVARGGDNTHGIAWEIGGQVFGDAWRGVADQDQRRRVGGGGNNEAS